MSRTTHKMKQIALLSLLIAFQFPTWAQTTTDKCTFEDARAWLTRPPADYELAFTHAWPGREAKFPPKNYYFIAYRGNHLLIKSTNSIAFDSQSVSNALPRQSTLMGKNGNVFWTLNEQNGTSELLVWTNRLEPSEINNQVLVAHRSSVESLQLLCGLGIQGMPTSRLQWQGINFSFHAETNGAFLRGTGHFSSGPDGSLKSADYFYERANGSSEAVKKFTFGVKYSGVLASSGYILPKEFGVWMSPKERSPYEVYRMRLAHFATAQKPVPLESFGFANYLTPGVTKVFFVHGTNLLYQGNSGELRAVIADPNDPRIVRQKNVMKSKNTYIISAAMLALFPVAFIAIKLWKNKKQNET